MKDTVENFVPDIRLQARGPEASTVESDSGASRSARSDSQCTADTSAGHTMDEDPWLMDSLPFSSDAGGTTASAAVDHTTARAAVHGPALPEDAYDQIYDNWEGIVNYNRPEEVQADDSHGNGRGESLLDEFVGGREHSPDAPTRAHDAVVEQEGPSFDLDGMSAEAVQDAIGM